MTIIIRGTGLAFDADDNEIADVAEEQGRGQPIREEVVPDVTHFIYGLLGGSLERQIKGRPFSRLEIAIQVERS